MIKRLASKETLLLSVMPLLAFALALLVAQTSLYTKVNAWLADTQQYLFAKEMYFDDVVFIDIDDATLFELEEDLGVWPYQRDVYALVLNYLTAKGADTVVFDLLLSESREGDQALAQAVQQHNNAVFIASSPVYASQRQYQGGSHERLLEQMAWQVSPQLPATQLNKLILPSQEFIVTEQGRGNVGVVDVLVDPDGTFRRIPALYQVGEHFFPSIPLLLLQKELKQKQWQEQQNARRRGEYLQDNLPASLLSYTGLSFDVDTRVISQGDKHWPVDEKGMFSLYFPKNANSVLSMSFYPVVQAAKGQFKPDNEDTFFQGKTVFISSTAFKSDLVNTPRGMMSGSYFLAIVYQNLKHNLLLKAPQQWLDGLLLAIALLPLCLFSLFFHHTPGRHLLLLLSSVTVIWGLNSAYLAIVGQQSTLLLPLLVLGGGYFLQSTALAKLSMLRNETLSRQARDLAESNEELALAASTDALTQLLNRRACLERFEALIEQYRRQRQPFSIAIIDLDHFKAVNDTHGHDIGDQVLKVFAEQMTASKRQYDIAARWGGEEFVLLLPGVETELAETVLERLRHNTSEMEVNTSDGPLKITVSIGAAQFSDELNSPEEAVALADKALYQAKAMGRNRVCLAEDVVEV